MYKKIKYRKLVRDKIPNKIVKDEDVLRYSLKPIDMFELPSVFADKVIEEADEVAKALVNYTNEAHSFTAVWEKEEELKSKLVEEIGDLLDVVDAIRKKYEIKKEDVKAARKEKNKKNGGFTKEYFLDWVERKVQWKLK
jgi:predicted house-cleaning noncanonical NTP pyrophosphatase (MazG superfamily)